MMLLQTYTKDYGMTSKITPVQAFDKTITQLIQSGETEHDIALALALLAGAVCIDVGIASVANEDLTVAITKTQPEVMH